MRPFDTENDLTHTVKCASSWVLHLEIQPEKSGIRVSQSLSKKVFRCGISCQIISRCLQHGNNNSVFLQIVQHCYNRFIGSSLITKSGQFYLADIYWASSLVPDMTMILFTQCALAKCNWHIVLTVTPQHFMPMSICFHCTTYGFVGPLRKYGALLGSIGFMGQLGKL